MLKLRLRLRLRLRPSPRTRLRLGLRRRLQRRLVLTNKSTSLPVMDDAQELVDFALRQGASLVVLSLWFWGGPTLPSLFLASLRDGLPHAKVAVLSDDVHHKRVHLGEIKEGRGGREASATVARVKEEELRAYMYADHVLTISPQDRQAVNRTAIRILHMPAPAYKGASYMCPRLPAIVHHLS